MLMWIRKSTFRLMLFLEVVIFFLEILLDYIINRLELVFLLIYGRYVLKVIN